MVITDAELDALQGLPLGAQVLYLREIRRYMDYSTGVTGIIRRISWDGLREVLEVEPRPGIARSLPSKQQVRRLAEWLERVGLVRNISDMTGKQLIFRLPLAVTDTCVQIKADTNPTQTRHSKPDTNPIQLDANKSGDFSSFQGEYPTDLENASYPEKPTHIRYPLSGDIDDDTGVGEWFEQEGGPSAQQSSSQPDGSAAVVAMFRGLLGEDAMPSRQLMEACGAVAAVAQARPVTEAELKAAILTARNRGVANVAPYAARIVENASLVAGKPRRPFVGSAGEDAAMAYLQGVYGACA